MVNTKVRSLSVATAVVALAASMCVSAPVQAAPGYVSNPIFQELAADVAYTNSLLNKGNAGTSEIQIDTYNRTNAGVNATADLLNFRFSRNASAFILQHQTWNISTQTFTNESGNSGQAGFDGNKSYYSISLLGQSAPTTELLKRLKKPTATFFVSSGTQDFLREDVLQPSIYLPVLMRSNSESGILLGLDYAISNYVPSDIQVESDTPSAGQKTFTLTVDQPAMRFTYIVNADSTIQSAQIDEFNTDPDTHQPVGSPIRTIVAGFNEINGSEQVVSLMPASAVTINSDEFLAMSARMAGESAVTPRANSIAISARVAAHKAKGKAKNKVTVAMIQNAAKKAGGEYTKIKSGVKLTGLGIEMKTPGYMCVTAVKNKAVVAHC